MKEMDKENIRRTTQIKKKGFISMYIGPMFGGKTSALLNTI
jgi:hypothetical protein